MERHRRSGHGPDQRSSCRPTRRWSAPSTARPATTASWSAPPAACRASCTSCGGPGAPNGYHMEYGFSCMGYEIAGGLGVKMALPEREVFVMVGDGSYMMMNSELQTSVMLGRKLIVTVLDNRGYGCINRLQRACGGDELQQPDPRRRPPGRRQLDRLRRPCPQPGCRSPRRWPASPIWNWRWSAPRQSERTYVVVIDTDPMPTTEAGGAWWDVAVPEASRAAAGQRRPRDLHQGARRAGAGLIGRRNERLQ